MKYKHTAVFAHRKCLEDGKWWRSPLSNRSWSNYSACINILEYKLDQHVIYVYFFGFFLSLIALLISLFIFTIYNRQLVCDRVRMHKHLFVCNLLNCITWIIYYSLVYSATLGNDVFEKSPIQCKLLHVISQYLTLSNHLWMFCEGMYLHTIIVFGFTTGRKLLITCYAIGWILPIIPTASYTCLRKFRNDDNDAAYCWYLETKEKWIISSFIIFTFAANLFFLFNIIRVLVTKLRAVNSPDTCQVKKAVRATMILIPLLGVQFIFFPIIPRRGLHVKKIYEVIVALVTSFQVWSADRVFLVF
ncbi:hypothetical protein HELRODRAFT_90909 [Helobdella robusta]|uniref:G-protein coupled receptors family 2 profile 2 domain-containing protein n=1 Tax=Helobdella robusta TaxID=6412 RepID=T1G7X8_HELRO|nr:hypothetical protein HELRODRAFT_90909 [Helobdella robusta]ESN90143.1 hypothetical protein HELRODRAFT_90909 [Helobdella robusta]